MVALTKQVAERSAKLRRTQDESGLDRFAARRIDFGDMDYTKSIMRRAVARLQAFFQQNPTMMLFDEVEDVFNDGIGIYGEKSTAQTRKAWMNRLLEENPVPTFWLGNSINSVAPAFIRRFEWVIELPVPPKTQRERIIRNHCRHILADQTIKKLAACEELAPAVVTRAAQVIGTLTNQFPVAQLSSVLQEMMDKTLQAQGHAGLNADNSAQLPDCYDPDLINCDADVKQIAAGIQRNGSARICLFGIPGTGKTAMPAGSRSNSTSRCMSNAVLIY